MSSKQCKSLGLTEVGIRLLVDTFYDRIQVHPDLGPVFEEAVSDWHAHRQRLTQFWCSVALGARSYRGNPLAMHRALPIGTRHFRQWLALWRTTSHEVLGIPLGTHMHDHARRIARGMQMGLGLISGPRDAPGVAGNSPSLASDHGAG